MAAHDRLDGLGGFVGVVEWDSRDIVVQDVGFDYSVEQRAADEAEIAIDRGSGSASKTPRLGSIMGDRRICVLQVRDGDLIMLSVIASVLCIIRDICGKEKRHT